MILDVANDLKWAPDCIEPHAIPGGSGYKRQVRIARMEFGEDGSIKPVDPPVPPFSPGDRGEPVTHR